MDRKGGKEGVQESRILRKREVIGGRRARVGGE
jgi:hypothetical protein